jgi:translocation and assembly module TamB
MDDRKAIARQSPTPGRKKRRFLKFVVAPGLFAIALVATLPWLLGTAPGRSSIVGLINSQIAPGSIRLGGLGLSWNRPVSLEGVTLLDPRGKTVLAAERVTLDRGLLGLLGSRPDYGTITIEGAIVDLERRADGSIDLLEALASVLKSEAQAQPPSIIAPAPGPAQTPLASSLALTVVLKRGSLKLASPELVEPFASGTLEGSLTIAPGKPIELSASLGDPGRSLQVHSTIDPGASGNVSLSLVGKDWPVHVRQAGVDAKGIFVGSLEAKQEKGFWSVKADTSMVGIEAAGPSLQGDHLKLDRVVAACDVEQSATGWSIRKLELTSPFASLKGSGNIPAANGNPAQLRGEVDLASLAKMLPNALRLRDKLAIEQGMASIRGDLTTNAGVDRLDMVASLDNFAASEGGREVRLRRPVFLSGKAIRSLEKVTVETLEVKAAGVDVTAKGDLDAGVKLAGTVDLVELTAQLRDILDLGTFDLSGHARLAADYRHIKDSYKGRFAVELNNLKVVGATTEPIARERARLEGWAIGPSQPDGLPKDWQQARLDLKAGDLKLDVQANSTDRDASLVAGFEMLVASPMPGRLNAKARLRKAGTVFDFDELAAGITPNEPKSDPGVAALAVRGKFDQASGEATFGPIPGRAIGAIGLGPDGAKLSGLGRSDLPQKVEASLVGDLAALDRLLASWNGTTVKGLGGLWGTRIGITRSTAGKLDVDGNLYVPDLAVSTNSRGPISLTWKAGYAPETDRLDLPSIELASNYGRMSLVAGMVDTKARRLFDLTAKFEPTWAAIDPVIAKSVEPDAKVRATVRPIHLAGQLQADSTPQLLYQVFGEVGLDITEARAFGVTLGPTPVVLKLGQGLAKFDPIHTTMNDGPVSIVADLALDGDQAVWLRLGNSKIDGAAINEAVSNAILAYVAPVLAKSSGVSGKVAVAIDGAFVPITASGPLSLDGALALQSVVFNPGPLGSELIALTGREATDLKLDQGMFVKVRNGRVQQNGLSIPLGGNGLVVALDGSVGFDKTLDLKATIPLTPRALGLPTSPGQPAGGPTVTLPITGTLASPSIDEKALRVALRDAAKAFGEKRLKTEASRLLERIASPKKPSGEPRSKPANRGPLGDLENLGREILDSKKP